MQSDKSETEPKQDALGKQLAELNNRARWYSTQLWTVPFAYLAVSAVAITGILKGGIEYLWIAFFACAVIGVFVVWHMQGIRDGEKRAVENLQKIEQQLHLERTAEYKHYTIPFLVAVWVFIVLFSVAGVLSACSQFP